MCRSISFKGPLLTVAAICALGLPLLAGRTPPGQQGLDPPRVVAGYLASFRLDRFPIRELEARGIAGRLTHLIYAFADVADGPVVSNRWVDVDRPYDKAASVDGVADDSGPAPRLRGAFHQLQKLKALHPQLRVLLSIGGASRTNAAAISKGSRTEASRVAFVEKSLETFIQGRLSNGVSVQGVFDGFDLDWEFPTDCGGGDACVAADTVNLTELLSEFRRQLDAQGRTDGRHYDLTLAGSAWADDYDKYEWSKIHHLLDFINVMTYGAPGLTTRPVAALYKSSQDTAGFGPTFNADYAVTRYLEAGVPADKIVLGIPFFALGWVGVPDVNHGLYQKASGLATGSIGVGAEQYARLQDLTGFERFRDPETKGVWLFNHSTRTLWAFDDPESIAAKMDYIKAKHLRGAMVWEIGGDDAGGALTRAIAEGLF